MSDSTLRVEITGRMVDIPEDECERHLQLGYVITVHKAQGSDWDRVIVMQPGAVRDDTARRFFYTALTRAKTQLAIISTLRPIAWWTNASADTPEKPSSLMKRLARPAPCIWCEYEGCAVCDPTIKATQEARWADRGPTEADLEPDWDALAEARHEAAEAAARNDVSENPTELLTQTPWRTLRQNPSTDQKAFYYDYESNIRPHEQAVAAELGMGEPLLVSERDDLDAAMKLAEIKAAFRVMEIA